MLQFFIAAFISFYFTCAAGFILDTQSAEVWSKHPDVAHHSSISENIFAMVQPHSLFNPISTPENAPVSCVTTDTTSCIQEEALPTVNDDESYGFSPFTQTSCVSEDTRSPATGTAPHELNPFAPSFDPPGREPDRTETEQNKDEIPYHISLLYKTTIAQTRLTADVDRQFPDVLR